MAREKKMAGKKLREGKDYEIVTPPPPRLAVLQSAMQKLARNLVPVPKQRRVKATIDTMHDGYDCARVADKLNGEEYMAFALFMAMDFSKAPDARL